ncbi:MAG: glycosyltransferase [Acetobacterium sp.]|uniref:glycosyltransferase n=1 Tax=Acetobacterium sp. TaxID=1872094 RepID=UPI0032429130
MKLVIVSNMYPDSKHPSYGIFVKKFCDQLDIAGIKYKKCVMLFSDSKIGKAKNYFLFYVKTVLKLLFGTYEIVYVHYASHSSIPVLIANKMRKKPIYTNVHGSDVVPENSKQEKLQKYTIAILGKSEKIVVPSEYFKKYVSQKYRLQTETIYVYPSAGVNHNVFHPLSIENKRNLKEKYGLDKRHLNFGMAGRISKDKGWDTYIEAVSKSISKGIKANYILVGCGPEEKELEQLIRKNKLEDVICRVGLLPQKELALFYGLIDYFIFPTKREGESLGLVAIEAMSCGIPVVSSSYAAPDYYVHDGINGYKFPVGNSNELSKIMVRLTETHNMENYNELSRGAQNTAKEYYEQNIMDKLKAIFET